MLIYGLLAVMVLIASPGASLGAPCAQWSFGTGDKIEGSPAIGDDGTIYIGSDDAILYAINADGSKKWSFKAGGFNTSGPVIGDDGTIYFGSNDGNLYALKADGTKKWSYAVGGGITSSPGIGADGTIYVGSDNGYLHAVKPDGTGEKWSYHMGNQVFSSPSIGPDGTIYVGSQDGYLHALNADGTAKWSSPTGSGVMSSPAIGEDGIVYVGSMDGDLYALYQSNGAVKWTFTTGGPVYSSPAIGEDGTIYIGSWDGFVYGVDPATGHAIWSRTIGTHVGSSPAVGDDGIVYIGSDDGNLYALDGITGAVKWTRVTGAKIFSSPVIGDNGSVFIGSYDYKLYASCFSSNGPGDTPWPMFRRHRTHKALATILCVTKAGNGVGTVTSTPTRIDCGSTCQASFPVGTAVTLKATPAAGSTFSGWSGGGCSGVGTCSLTMTSSKCVQATFTGHYTLVTLKSFTAASGAAKATLLWTTASEYKNAGFHILRSESPATGFVRITPHIIAAKGTVVKGASYSYVDKGLKAKKTYYYKLQDIETTGKATLHGPVQVTTK